MNRLFCFLFLASLPLTSEAQTYVTIPNGSFENWVPAAGPAGAMDPPPWSTFNPGTATQVVPAVSRSSDAVDGNWSVILRPLQGYDSVFGGYLNRMQFYGPNPLIDTDVVVPKRFSGWYKFAKDSSLLNAGVVVCFQRSGTSTVCGKGYALFKPVPTSVWTQFSVELDSGFVSGPVTGYHVLAYLDTQDTSTYPTTYLQLDGLQFEYDTASTNAISSLPKQTRTSISPNPTSGKFVLSWQDALPGSGVVLIQSLTGQTLRQIPVQKGTHTLEADASFLPAGQYLIRLISPGYNALPLRLVRQF